MTGEQARILAQALTARWAAESILTALQRTAGSFTEIPEMMEQSMKIAAETYVHESRIINRIVSEALDD